jgi:hypothetical protein
MSALCHKRTSCVATNRFNLLREIIRRQASLTGDEKVI